LLAFLLVPLNWFCEWQKWRITLKAAEVRSTNRLAFNAFLAGIVSGMLTPNMLGNFIGRIFYFQRRDRIAITVYTMFSNYGQFAASVIVGLICIYFLNETPFGELPDYFIWLTVPVILFVFILHFYFDFFFSKIFKRRMRELRIQKKNRLFGSFHWKVLFWSLFRLSVFSIQFYLVLVAFGAEFNFILFLWIGQYYFWVTLAPSLFFGKVVIRDSIALWVLVAVIANSSTIVVASFSIWIINLLLPTLFSVLFFRSKKVIV
jgi:uncharacterized membrane protein YbhN (UPF0104 family)